MEADIDNIIAYNKVLGNNIINCAGAGAFADYDTVCGYADRLAVLADKLAANGMKIYYHNVKTPTIKYIIISRYFSNTRRHKTRFNVRKTRL